MADQRSYFVPFDLDSGGGTEQVVGMSPRGAASGGSAPIFVDPVALADNKANPTVGAVATFPYVFDGATWDRMLGDATNGLLVNLGANNDVSISGSVDTELPAAAALTDNFANPTAPGVGAFGMLWDGATWDRQAGNSADGTLVNLGANNDVSIAGTVTVDTELPAAGVISTDNTAAPSAPQVYSHMLGFDGTDWARVRTDAAGILQIQEAAAMDVSAATVTVDSELPAAAALGDATANPTVPGVGSFLNGFNGTTWDRVRTANTGRLQVDVITGGGTDAPTNPINDSVTSASIAVATPTNIDSADDDNKKLSWIDIWSSVAWKGEIHTMAGAVQSGRKGVTGGAAFQAVQWRPTHRDFVQTGADAGVDTFRLIFTNLDDNQAADAHVVFHYED